MNKKGKLSILVIDDEPGLQFVLGKGLKNAGFDVDTADNLEEGEKAIASKKYVCIFLDIILPDGSGLDLLKKMSSEPENPAVVVMTAEATMQNAIEAMRRGAYDYLTKPFDLDDVEKLVKKIVAYKKIEIEPDETEPEPAAGTEEHLVGRSAPMQELFKLIGRSADSSATVLITGPSGAGKELVAKAFHQNSSRSKANFITVNCAAIPADLLESELFGYVKGAFTGAEESRKGKFLSADGGTVLLDEVGDMSLPLQAKMLRVLQEREVYPVGAVAPVKVDVRVLAATNRDLVSDVNEGRFREDLYHRLNVVHVSLPPLSARKDDIPLLVNHFLRVDAKGGGDPAKTMAGSALDILCSYNWPGNVRELANCVRRALLMAPGKVITPDHLPPELLENRSEDKVDLAEEKIADAVAVAMSMAEDGKVHSHVIGLVEKALYKKALEKSGGKKAGAARYLGVNRNTLMKKYDELGLSKNLQESAKKE